MSRSILLNSLIVIGVVLLSGCSLITVETGIVALSDKEIEMRVATREFALKFAQRTSAAAAEIDARSDDPIVELDALRWHVAAVTSSRQAALQTAPALALLDTWALAEQQRRYFAPNGAGEALFGDLHPLAADTAESLASQIETIAGRLLPGEELELFRKVVDTYVDAYPITSLRFDRESVLVTWSELAESGHTLVTSVGTSPQVVNDLTDRLRIFGEQLPDEIVLQTQLRMRENGVEAKDVQDALTRLKDDLDRLAAVAETSPELVRQAVASLREEFDPTLEKIDGRVVNAMDRLTAERQALATDLDELRIGLAASVAQEREEITRVLAVERAAMMTDARVIANDVTDKSWKQVRGLVREVGLILIVLALIVLGLPFYGGYMLGKSVARRSDA